MNNFGFCPRPVDKVQVVPELSTGLSLQKYLPRQRSVGADTKQEREEMMRMKPARNGYAWLKPLNWLLTSGVLALIATLAGLLYLSGRLGVFGVQPTLFLPESALELTHWAYAAILQVWAAGWNGLPAATWWVLTYVGLGVGLGVALILGSRWMERSVDAVRRHAVVQSKWFSLFLSAAIPILAVPLLPWLFMLLAAFALAFPLPAHSLGQRAALAEIAAYDGGRSGRCVQIGNANGLISKCALLIAQNKAWIAYLDGDQVHIVPADGATSSRPLPPPTKKSPQKLR
jgi:hypothetical protein